MYRGLNWTIISFHAKMWLSSPVAVCIHSFSWDKAGDISYRFSACNYLITFNKAELKEDYLVSDSLYRLQYWTSAHFMPWHGFTIESPMAVYFHAVRRWFLLQFYRFSAIPWLPLSHHIQGKGQTRSTPHTLLSMDLHFECPWVLKPYGYGCWKY